MRSTSKATSLPTAFLSPSSLPLQRTLLIHSKYLCCASTTKSFNVSKVNGPNGLPNFRDLSSAAPYIITPNRIFRGATPASLPFCNGYSTHFNDETSQFLQATSCFVDLRSKDERMSDNKQKILIVCGNHFEQKEIHVGLLNKRRVVWGLLNVIPSIQLKQLISSIFFNPFNARKLIVNRIDQGGLILLNKILVKAGKKSIAHALNNITNHLNENSTNQIYFYCSAGKDRTGLIAALILKLCGVDDKHVIFDYVRSSETWENGPQQIRKDYNARLEHAGLTPLNWIGCPPFVMQETLAYIRQQYGSIENYVIHCGFEQSQIETLKNQLILTTSPSPSSSSSSSSSISSSSSSNFG